MTSTATPPRARTTRRDWLLPAGLIALSFVPVVAGGLRVLQLVFGVDAMPPNPKYTSPAPVLLHIVGASTFAILGALQFAPRLRRTHPRFHRIAGRIVVPAGLVTAVSGVWITVLAPRAPEDGDVVAVIRVIVGSAMVGFLVAGFVTATRRDFAAHRRWMIRGYALGLGAGTQFFTQVVWLLTVGPVDRPGKAITLTAGWLINVVVAERVIRRHK